MATNHTAKKAHKRISRLSRWQLTIFALLFAIIGGYAIYRTFAAPNPNLPGDLNNDNVVNVVDLSILLSKFGTTNLAFDINGSGSINITDLSILLTNYNRRYTPPTAVKTATVSITNSGFVPATISIKAGDQVTWINNDSVPRQVAADPHPAHDSIVDFDSSIALQPGDSLGFFFETAGTFTLHDESNPSDSRYRLTIVVQ
ncbi:MAG TPA: dockerin type I domain-containing protein [Candidatus Saccharimonadales bacterium]|nr:dockerin type I domain-containing protein [Candidatus Saccharimonadales bacterium]